MNHAEIIQAVDELCTLARRVGWHNRARVTSVDASEKVYQEFDTARKDFERRLNDGA